MLLGLVFIATNFVYCLITSFVYLSKKRINSIETKIYGVVIFATLLSLVLEMSCGILIQYNPTSALTYIVNKAHIADMCFWITIFTIYIVLVCFDNDSNIKRYEKNKYIIYIYILIMTIIAFTLPLEYYNDGTSIYTTGLAPSLIVILGGLYLIVDIYSVIKNIKRLKKIKLLPLVALIIGFSSTIVLRNISPGLVFMSSIFTIVTVLMYHTIENPDMKLLEEIHKSKEISDSANEEKTLFLYNMTQEIRNINKKIDDDADIILDSKDWEETYESARDIKSLTSKFNTMTNEILDISQINSSNIKVYNSKYNIKNILKHIVNIYSDICKEKELKFITNIDHNIPEILYGDSIGLKEILTIILDNSTKYTEKGYIEFNVNTIIKNDICRLIITIEDSGTGISSENINKIKIDKKSLSKANELTTLMNGTMIISSDYGKGTKIKIILDQKIELIENEEVFKYKKIFDNVEILAIDDSESGLKIIDKLLRDTNIKIDKAINGKESINKIKINKYDVILLDEQLSQISGTELIKKIKEIRNFNTPIILLTKDNSYEYNEEHLKLGFNDYILKPLKKDNLLDKINKYTKKDN